jgi:hypothetical protein
LRLKVTGERVLHSGGPPMHLHEAENEIVIVLEGQLEDLVGEQRGALSSGGLLRFPRQVPHAAASLAVATPSGIEDFIRAQRDCIASLPAGTPPDAVALGAVTGTEERRVVGPPLTRRA